MGQPAIGPPDISTLCGSGVPVGWWGGRAPPPGGLWPPDVVAGSGWSLPAAVAPQAAGPRGGGKTTVAWLAQALEALQQSLAGLVAERRPHRRARKGRR